MDINEVAEQFEHYKQKCPHCNDTDVKNAIHSPEHTGVDWSIHCNACSYEEQGHNHDNLNNLLAHWWTKYIEIKATDQEGVYTAEGVGKLKGSPIPIPPGARVINPPNTKSLYEIKTARFGESFERCYVWAESNSQTAAFAVAVTKHGKKIIDGRCVINELFQSDAADFCTPLSGSGFEED